MASNSGQTAGNLSDFLRLVQQVPESDGSPRWYRGCGKSSYELTPTLYRHPSTNSIEELMSLESSLIDRFKERSIPYLTRNLERDWEYLFFMQHYGVPTRLLDWTESPFFALYFAVDSAEYNHENGEVLYSGDATVWVLNPIAWNRWALSYRSFNGGVISSGDPDALAYAPNPDLAVMGNEPLAIYGRHNSPRIVAQRGVFTVFGKSTDPMENKQLPQDILSKIVIPRENIASIFNELTAVGITDASIFPDLDGLAKELKRNFGFEV